LSSNEIGLYFYDNKWTCVSLQLYKSSNRLVFRDWTVDSVGFMCPGCRHRTLMLWYSKVCRPVRQQWVERASFLKHTSGSTRILTIGRPESG
jgi:hypothetical protein